MQQRLIFNSTMRKDTSIGQTGRTVADGARKISAHALEITAEHFHGGHSAAFHRHQKRREIREGSAHAPQSQSFIRCQVAGFGGTRRAEIPHAGLWEKPLQGNPHIATQRAVVRRGLAAVRRGGGILHQVGLVEGDHAVEVLSKPVGQLLEALALAREIGAEHRVGREENSRRSHDAFLRFVLALVQDIERHAHGTTIPLRIGTKLMRG